jgi:GntR family transcriptional repressor for pyruvate dehydrogenase complex
MQFETIKTDRLYIKVAEQLRTLIDNGYFKVGDSFPAERALAEKLGVSRPTIREAMIALELSGLVEIRTGSGIYVTGKKQDETSGLLENGVGLAEILEMRYILEPEVCALAASRITDIQIQHLKDIIKEMEVVDITPEAFEKADCKLHLAIAEASENEAIKESIKWLWKLREESIFTSCIQEEIEKQGVCIDEHKRIVSAIAQKNPERARIAMKNHLDNATTTTDFDL